MFSESDKFCNFCGNKWIIPGQTPESKLFQDANVYFNICLDAIVDPSHPFFNDV